MKNEHFIRGQEKQIFLVEDDDVVATFPVEVLGRLGKVHWTASAEQAAAVLGNRDWDLIISDIDLAGMNGLEFVRAAQRSEPPIARLILSGHSSFDSVEALRAGADDDLTKPRNRRATRMTLDELLLLAPEPS